MLTRGQSVAGRGNPPAPPARRTLCGAPLRRRLTKAGDVGKPRRRHRAHQRRRITLADHRQRRVVIEFARMLRIASFAVFHLLPTMSNPASASAFVAGRRSASAAAVTSARAPACSFSRHSFSDDSRAAAAAIASSPTARMSSAAAAAARATTPAPAATSSKIRLDRLERSFGERERRRGVVDRRRFGLHAHRRLRRPLHLRLRRLDGGPRRTQLRRRRVAQDPELLQPDVPRAAVGLQRRRRRAVAGGERVGPSLEVFVQKR